MSAVKTLKRKEKEDERRGEKAEVENGGGYREIHSRDRLVIIVGR